MIENLLPTAVTSGDITPESPTQEVEAPRVRLEKEYYAILNQLGIKSTDNFQLKILENAMTKVLYPVFLTGNVEFSSLAEKFSQLQTDSSVFDRRTRTNLLQWIIEKIRAEPQVAPRIFYQVFASRRY